MLPRKHIWIEDNYSGVSGDFEDVSSILPLTCLQEGLEPPNQLSGVVVPLQAELFRAHFLKQRTNFNVWKAGVVVPLQQGRRHVFSVGVQSGPEEFLN